MAQKFIINDNRLIIGDVEYHTDLHKGGLDSKKTVGGGKWHYDKEKKTVYFWGVSTEFGQVTMEDFTKDGLAFRYVVDDVREADLGSMTEIRYATFMFSTYPGEMNVSKMDVYVSLFEEIKQEWQK